MPEKNPTADTMRLESLTPTDALDLYLKHRKPNVSEATYYAHESRLGHFLRWCDENDITDMNDLSGRDMHRYRLWRQDDGDLNRVSVRTQMSTLTVFIRFCEQIDAVRPGLEDSVDVPELDPGENARNVYLTAERAHDIMDYLRKFEYASRNHVMFELMWHTAMRIGALVSIDCADFQPDGQLLTVTHRAEYGTALKNKQRGERHVALNDRVTELIADWIAMNRPDKTDAHGREALLTTRQSGRIGTTTIRNATYKLTAPPFIGESCVDECDLDDHSYHGSAACPQSRSPHAIRRGAITNHLRQDVPKAVVSDRCDVSQNVLDQHYNELTEAEKVERRRQYIDTNRDDAG
jgi:integrase